MPYVVTQSCCADASCVYACPVNCIHPTPDEPDFGTAEMLHVDPAACVECGACVTACPVDAIKPHGRLTAAETPFLQINADFYARDRPRPVLARPVPAAALDPECGPVRVAIVGSGPAAMYAADELLTQPGVRVDVYERLDRPYGLARFGVAPDHGRTRRVRELFDMVAAQPGFSLHTGVAVGTDVLHADLLAAHDAVIYAVGAATDRRLGIPGEDRPGCCSATDFVAWYNGHPEHTDDRYPLDGPRAVVIGNGNVALDVARILARDPGTLVGTGIAGGALTALRSSAIDEVVVAARRGPAESAFTLPELVGLISTPGVEVVVDAPGGIGAEAGETGRVTAGKLALLRTLPSVDEPRRQPRRIVLRYRSAPVEVLGEERVRGIALTRTEPVRDEGGRVGARAVGPVEVLDTALVLTSVGYRGVAVPGLPFDPVTGAVPNVDGRVIDADGRPVPRTYVTGWIKRGPTGFLGTNKSDAQQTVAALVADANAGRLTPVPSV